MATAPATPEKMTLDRTDGSATIALYRAALGPLHTDYYLKAFTHFDALGKTHPRWNWTAALLTLNWLLFRQLWVAALAYTGALVAAALLLVGIARLVFQVSAEVQWLLAGVALLLAVGLPGTLGNAWLYAACNKKMERALVDSATLEEACALLAAKAAGRKRIGGLLAANLVLGAWLAALVFFWPDSHSLPVDPDQLTHRLPVESLHSGLAAQSVGAVSTAPALAAAVAASAPVALASAPTQPSSAPLAPPPPAAASRTSQGVVQPAAVPSALLVQPSAMAVAVAAMPPASAPPLALQSPAAVPVKPAPTSVATVAAKPDKKHLSAREARAEKAAKLAEKRLQAQKDKAAKTKATNANANSKAAAPAPATVPAAQPARAASATATVAEKLLINVGLFADANNARNAVAKLQDAGLPALSQEIKSSKGPRTRVRVGPFETQAEADRVADQIRALKLDAVVFKP